MSLDPFALKEFIAKYRELECLWDVNHKDYRNKLVKLKAFEELAAIMRKTDEKANVDAVKKKINNFRSSFNKEFNKVKSSYRKGSEDIYVPKLWYFDLLLFLVDSNPKKKTGDLSAALADSSEFLDLDDNSSTPEKDFKESKYVQVSWQTSDADEDLSLDDEASEPAPKTNTPNCSWKPSRKRSLNAFPEIQSAIKQLKQISNANSEQTNEFDVFCESLAIQLKKMPLSRALMCQEQLQSVMTRERLYQLSEAQSSVSDNPTSFQ